MALLIDLAASNERLSDEAFAHWAPRHTVFVSSEMRDLAAERAVVADALRATGLQVVLFEDLGGRDEDAQRAYLEGVARSDIYLGFVADRYGTMQPSGRSPTHDEYRYARELGKRISFWVAREADGRQGDARDFVAEVQVFHTTGGFTDGADLAARVVERMREIAADDEAPWVKVGDAVFRASRIRDLGDRVEINADVRDPALARYLVGLRPGDTFGRVGEVRITTTDASGQARVEAVDVETTSRSAREVTLRASIDWNASPGGHDAGTAGMSPADLAEVGLRAGLLGEPLPESLRGMMSFMAPSDDPLAPLDGVALSPPVAEHVARLLLVEHLIGSGLASSVDFVALGPEHQGRRRLELVYTERRRYANQEPGQRRIEGVRAVGGSGGTAA